MAKAKQQNEPITRLDDHPAYAAAKSRLEDLQSRRLAAVERRRELEATLPAVALTDVSSRAAVLVAGGDIDNSTDAAVVDSHRVAREEFETSQRDEAVLDEAVRQAKVLVDQELPYAIEAVRESMQPQADEITRRIQDAATALLNAFAEREELMREARRAGIGLGGVRCLPDFSAINLPAGRFEQQLHVWAAQHEQSFSFPDKFHAARKRLKHSLGTN